MKAEDVNGVVAIIPDDSLNKYILLILEEGRVKLRFHLGATHVVTESIEHILIGEWFEVIMAQDDKHLYMQINGNEKKYVPSISERMITSPTNVFIGAIRDEMRVNNVQKFYLRHACDNILRNRRRYAPTAQRYHK